MYAGFVGKVRVEENEKETLDVFRSCLLAVVSCNTRIASFKDLKESLRSDDEQTASISV